MPNLVNQYKYDGYVIKEFQNKGVNSFAIYNSKHEHIGSAPTLDEAITAIKNHLEQTFGVINAMTVISNAVLEKIEKTGEDTHEKH